MISGLWQSVKRKVGSMTVGDNTISGSPVKKRPRLSLKKHGSQGEEQKKEVKLTSEINENTSDSPPTGDNAPCTSTNSSVSAACGSEHPPITEQEKSISEDVPRKVLHNVSGLENLGNTCFLNSILQVLRYTPGFSQQVGFLAKELTAVQRLRVAEAKDSEDEDVTDPLPWKLVRSLHKLFQRMDRLEERNRDPPNGADSIYTKPERLLDIIRDLNPMFEGTLQHDSHEVLRCILAYVEDANKELQRIKQSKSDSNTVVPVNGQGQKSLTDFFKPNICKDIKKEIDSLSSYSDDSEMLGQTDPAADLGQKQRSRSGTNGASANSFRFGMCGGKMQLQLKTPEKCEQVETSDECIPDFHPKQTTPKCKIYSVEEVAEQVSGGKRGGNRQKNTPESVTPMKTISSTKKRNHINEKSPCHNHESTISVIPSKQKSKLQQIMPNKSPKQQKFSLDAAVDAITCIASDDEIDKKSDCEIDKETDTIIDKETDTKIDKETDKIDDKETDKIDDKEAITVRGQQTQKGRKTRQTSEKAKTRSLSKCNGSTQREDSEAEPKMEPKIKRPRGRPRRTKKDEDHRGNCDMLGEPKLDNNMNPEDQKTKDSQNISDKSQPSILSMFGRPGSIPRGPVRRLGMRGRVVRSVSPGDKNKGNPGFVPVIQINGDLPTIEVEETSSKLGMSPVVQLENRVSVDMGTEKGQQQKGSNKLEMSAVVELKDIEKSPVKSINTSPLKSKQNGHLNQSPCKKGMSNHIPIVKLDKSVVENYSSPKKDLSQMRSDVEKGESKLTKYSPVCNGSRSPVVKLDKNAVENYYSPSKVNTTASITSVDTPFQKSKINLNKRFEDLENACKKSGDGHDCIKPLNCVGKHELKQLKQPVANCNLVGLNGEATTYPTVNTKECDQTKSNTCGVSRQVKQGGAKHFPIVEEIFQGTVALRTRCLECECYTERKEDFQDIGVPVKKEKVKRKSVNDSEDEESPDEDPKPGSIQWLMDAFSEVERLQDDNKYYCDKCQALVEAERSMMYETLPQVLTLHLKRFEANSGLYGGVSKINDFVETPLIIPCFSAACGQPCLKESHRYELYAVVMHAGISIGSGHYVSCVKAPTIRKIKDPAKVDQKVERQRPVSARLKRKSEEKEQGNIAPTFEDYSGQWFLFDDDTVTLQTSEAVLQTLSQEMISSSETPYLLFYSKAGLFYEKIITA